MHRDLQLPLRLHRLHVSQNSLFALNVTALRCWGAKGRWRAGSDVPFKKQSVVDFFTVHDVPSDNGYSSRLIVYQVPKNVAH